MISSQNSFSSRKVILEMLEKRGFNVDTYKNYTIVELETMKQNSTSQNKTTSEVQPDIMTEVDSGNKALVKYIFTSKSGYIASLLIELKENETLSEGDTFILITKDRNIGKAAGQDTAIESQLEALYNEHKVFVHVLGR